MNLQQLKKKGGVVTDALVKKEVVWKHLGENGEEIVDKFKIHVRRHTFGNMESMFAGGEAEISKNARYLSASVMLGDKGTEELPFADAVNLDPALGFVLLTAVNEVNHPVKNSAPPTN